MKSIEALYGADAVELAIRPDRIELELCYQPSSATG